MDESAPRTEGLTGRALGEFVVGDRIGAGGWGEVYLARQRPLDREVVIKVLRRRGSGGAEQRFLREARLLSLLDHPYAAHVYAFGAEPDGVQWIAMELVRGTPLDVILAAGPMPLERFTPLLDKLCEVVHTAHERRVIHRDIKPANVMVLERAGRYLPKLLDLGIGKLLEEQPAATVVPPARTGTGASTVADDDADATDEDGDDGAADTTDAVTRRTPGLALAATAATPSRVTPDPVTPTPERLTLVGALLGSPPYMAPELWGAAAGAGPRADQYALAVLAFEALTGRLPFGGDRRQLARAHARSPVPPLGPGVPASLDEVLGRALAKSPDNRFPDVLAFAAAFRAASVVTDEAAPRFGGETAALLAACAPQPIADAAAGLEAARNVHQARDALADVVRATTRTAAVLALAGHSRGGGPLPGEAADLLRGLRDRELTDTEWLTLARALVRPTATRAGTHALPGLVRWLDASGAIDRLLESLAGRKHAAALVADALPDLAILAEEIAFLSDTPLVVPRADGAERWMGIKRARPAAAPLRGDVPAGRPLLTDGDGRPILALWPLVQVAAPAPGAAEELFLLDGRTAEGARLTARPLGFERRDPEVWHWLGEQVLEPGAPDLAATTEEAPYRGLAAFGESDADRFFGRERDVEAVSNRLRAHPLVTVVGPSGAGKSSFLHAGISPRLPAGWRAIALRPGPAPLLALAHRLVRAGLSRVPGPREAEDLRDRLAEDPAAVVDAIRRAFPDGVTVLCVDQLEELLTQCRDPAERQAFAAALAQAARGEGCRVLVALRDDFLTKLDALAPLQGTLARSLHLLSVPTAEDLRRILVEPARRAGWTFDDPTLPDEMVAAVADEPAALALLSFTAAKLWERRDRHFRRLTRAAYEALGGVGGALAQHAEATLAALPASEQRVVRAAFRHLITAEGTRATLSRRELHQLLARAAPERAGEVIEHLLAARLCTATEGPDGEDRVEIVHETLLTAWPRLSGWREEDREGARLRDQLRAAARQWDERGRPRGLLWRDDALVELRRWRARHAVPLTAAEEAFADASLRDAARARRRRTALVATAFTVLAAGAAGLYVAGRAARARTTALIQERGRDLLLQGEARRALPLLADAYRRGADGPPLHYLIARAADTVEAERAVLHHDGRVNTIFFNPAGDRVATCSDDHTAVVWDAITGARVFTLQHPAIAGVCRWSPDGTQVATSGHDGAARIWDARDGHLIYTLYVPSYVGSLTYSPDGAQLATVGPDAVVRLWDAHTGKLSQALYGHTLDVKKAVFSRDGAQMCTVGNDGVRLWTRQTGAGILLGKEGRALDCDISPDGKTVVTAAGATMRIWSTADGTLLRTGQGHSGDVGLARFSPDGRRVLTGSEDCTARIWDAETLTLVASLVGHHGSVKRAAYTPDGKLVATGSQDGAARLWDAENGTPLAVFHGHDDSIWGMHFDPTGKLLATASYDGTARIWDATRHGLVLSIAAHNRRVRSVAFSPDGTRIASGAGDRTARIWDAQSGRELITLPHPSTVWGVAFRPDGKRLLTAGEDGAARIFDAETGALLASLPHPGIVWNARYDETGARIATACRDGKARIFDAATGALLASLPHPNNLDDAAFHGGRLVTAGADRVARVWDLASERVILEIPGHRLPINRSLFSPDGGRIVTIGEEHVARMWNAETGALIAPLEGHTSQLTAVDFSPDGGLVATASLDRTARVWDPATGEALSVLEAHRHWVDALAFSPDGKRIATSGADGMIHVWDARVDTRSVDEVVALLRGHGLSLPER